VSQSQHQVVLRYLRRVAGTAGAGDVSDADLLARFVASRDEAAFELLLWRHGTMVLHVCRDVTRDEHAAEDAFQATFLALVRKAATIRARESLGAWLYQVAYRVALRARRSERETVNLHAVGVAAARELPDETELRELRPLLHQEVQRLPAKYRTPIVLCYLEGLTHEEAARQLGWPKGTVAGRLARAREMLRKRLTRCGVALSTALAALALAPASASGLVPPGLVQLTLKSCALLASGGATAGLVSAHVLALSEGVMRTMLWTKMKAVAALVLLLGLAGGGVSLLAGGRPAQQTEAIAQDEAQPKARTPKKETKLDGDAKATATARAQSRNNLKTIGIAMHNYHDMMGSFPPAATYGRDGKPQLSWRVLLLPFLGDKEGELYKQFHLNEPWDSPHNKKLIERMPKTYLVPGQKEKNATFYQVFVGEDTVFERRKGGAGGGGILRGGQGGASGRQSDGLPALPHQASGYLGGQGGAGSQPVGTLPGGGGPPQAGGAATTAIDNAPVQRGLRITDIVDGTSNTLLVVEGGSAIPWTKPEDLPYAATGKLPALGGAFKEVIHALWADGFVSTLKKKFDETAMRAAITRNGGEVYDRDALIDPAPGTDEEELKLLNDDLRKQVADARAAVSNLQEQLREMRTALKRNGNADDAVTDKLKSEQIVLRQELERLDQEAKRLHDQIERLKRGEEPVPTKPRQK
jgi:RNA polymerase sigma factor (sigma-70 family)